RARSFRTGAWIETPSTRDHPCTDIQLGGALDSFLALQEFIQFQVQLRYSFLSETADRILPYRISLRDAVSIADFDHLRRKCLDVKGGDERSMHRPSYYVPHSPHIKCNTRNPACLSLKERVG